MMTEEFKPETEKTVEEIIDSNLQKMQTDMIDLMYGESFGGNAGSIMIDGKEYYCAGTNGELDRLTGEIIVFGNSQDGQVQNALINDTDNTLNGFIFRIALHEKGNPLNSINRIVGIGYDNDEKNPHAVKALAKYVIEQSISRYNQSISTK